MRKRIIALFAALLLASLLTLPALAFEPGEATVKADWLNFRNAPGMDGKVIGLANSPKSTQRIKDLGFCDVVESVAGMTPVEVYELVYKLTDGKMADVTINNVNVPDTEMTSVLCTKDDGIVYFFSMATSFTKAALGAEGIGADVNMIVGNGYTKGHAEFTLQELRESPELRKIFEELYA